MADQLTLFFDAWELFREPTLAGAVAGLVLGVVGVWIVLRRMVFLSAALSQVAGLGVALAFLLSGWLSEEGLGEASLLPGLGAILLTIGAALSLSRRDEGADAQLGLLFLGASAGTLAIGTRIVQELHDIDTLLFGSAVAVLPTQFRWLVVVCVLILAVHAWWWRGFAAITADRDDAAVRAMPVRVLEITLVVTAALGVAVTTWVLGALPAFAFSVLPGLAALSIAPNVRTALVVAAGLGAIAGFGGYLAAFLWDLPVGAAQTLVGLIAVVVCGLIGRVSR